MPEDAAPNGGHRRQAGAPTADGEELQLLRSAALATANSVLVLQQRAEEELLAAKQALEQRTEQLTQSLALLNATLESTPYGIVAIDLAGAVMSWNSKFLAIWGLTAETIPRDAGALDRHIVGFVASPSRYEGVVRDRAREPSAEGVDVVAFVDGRTFERHVFPQRRGSEVTGVIVNWRDVSEREQLAARFRQSQKMEAIGTLASGIAHDFNNLLSTIIGYAELVDASLGPGAPEHHDLQQIRGAGERAAMLTRQLLTFASRLPTQAHAVDLRTVVTDLERLLSRVIDANIEIDTRLPDQQALIHADPAEIDQVVMNLAINARDAMPGGGRLLIAVALVEHDAASDDGLPRGRYVELTVSDTGVGMAPDVLDHVFEPFFTTKRAAGSGLGLATVYGIVERHGGRVTADSSPDAGTSVRVLFKRSTVLPDVPATEASAPRSRAGETILVVEDDPAVRELTRRALASAGYRILVAESGVDAIAIAQERAVDIDLLLSDVMMPGMTGPEVAARIRALRPGIPVLLMSGYAGSEIDTAPEDGAPYAFLAKPFTTAQLATQVRAAIDPVLERPPPGAPGDDGDGRTAGPGRIAEPRVVEVEGRGSL